jgi:hypothetical protein
MEKNRHYRHERDRTEKGDGVEEQGKNDYPQLEVAGGVDEQAKYRLAAEILWGEAGAWAVDEYARLNGLYFGGRLPPVPLVIGMTAYGRCVGLTRYRGEWDDSLPRITLQSSHFRKGTDAVSDTILHEMVHVRLKLAGLCTLHNARPWCAEVARLSPLVFGIEVKVQPVHPRRGVGRQALEGHLTRKQLAGWPDCLRGCLPVPSGPLLRVATY